MKTSLKTLLLVVALTAAPAAIPAYAHHSGAMFDSAKEVRLDGVIKGFRWSNPHAWIEIDVPDAQGKVITWSIEMTSPALLKDDGWTRSTVKTGDKVVLFAAPLRDGKPGASFIAVKLSDGRFLGRGAPRD